MTQTFEITHDRAFLEHFLTRWRTLSISPEMVERLRTASGEDYYAAYGYGRWLSLVNPGGNSLKEAEDLLSRAGTTGNVQDALAALAELFYDARTEAGKADHGMHAILMDSSYKAGSELAQFETLEHTIYGDYGFPANPAEVADILRTHLEKNPGSDPIYYDLLGQALEESGTEGAETAYLTALERGETEAYYSLANLYKGQGDWERGCRMADEGALAGAVNCRRFKALMEQEDFEKLPEGEQKTLHEEVASGLDYAIAHNDRYACFLKGVLLYMGQLGFENDTEAALQVLQRGCEMGLQNCYTLIAAIQSDDTGKADPKVCLQAVRLGQRDRFCLDEVAKAYVEGQLSGHEEEIESLWLEKYNEEAMKAAGENDEASGVMEVYPNGTYYAREADEVNADGFDIVHFSPLLTRITRALCLGGESRHVAMLVEKDGYARDLPDNMTGTIVYGQAAEIRGTVVFVLEDDRDYSLLPMTGLQKIYMFLQLLQAATGDLLRPLESEDDGFEEYDDHDFYDDPDELEGYEPEQEVQEDMVSVDTCDCEPAKEITVSPDGLEEALEGCNLCVDTVFVDLGGSHAFESTEDLFYSLGIKDEVEKNIACHGGYMIDEWQYVDQRQIPMDIRSRVRFK